VALIGIGRLHAAAVRKSVMPAHFRIRSRVVLVLRPPSTLRTTAAFRVVTAETNDRTHMRFDDANTKFEEIPCLA
jgi:hypothetical protein